MALVMTRFNGHEAYASDKSQQDSDEQLLHALIPDDMDFVSSSDRDLTLVAISILAIGYFLFLAIRMYIFGSSDLSEIFGVPPLHQVIWFGGRGTLKDISAI